jgi:hypothetical protein
MSCRHCIYQSVVYEGQGEIPAVAEDDDFEKSFPSRCGHGWGKESDCLSDEGYQAVDVDNHLNRAKSTLPCPTYILGVISRAFKFVGPWTPSCLCSSTVT